MQGHAGELVYEADADQRPDTRKEYGNQQREQRHQQAVLEAGAAGESSRDVAADDEGQQQRYEESDQGRRSALCGGLSGTPGS